MLKRLTLILILLAALALACTRSAPIQLPQMQSGSSSPAAPAASPDMPAMETVPTATPDAVFLPDINTGEGQAEVQPPQTETPGVATTPPAPNIFFLPHVGSGREGGDGQADGGQAPGLTLEANPASLRVGETLTVVGRPFGIGLPYYDLIVQDLGAAQAQNLGQVTYENETRPQPGLSQVLELVSAEGSMDQVTFVLRAKAAGTTAVQIVATGEVQTESGAFTWSGGSSQALAIMVTE